MANYQPTEVDILWMKHVVAVLADGGSWGWPDTGMVFKHDEKARKLVLQNPELLKDPHVQEMFDRCVAVCKEIRYTVGTK